MDLAHILIKMGRLFLDFGRKVIESKMKIIFQRLGVKQKVIRRIRKRGRIK